MKAMKIKKGDTVHVLAGKDRGKQGRVLEARPDEKRVVVENLNMIKRHSRPKPIKNPSRMGGAAGHARRRDRQGRADPDLERDARLPDVQPPDPSRLRGQGAQGEDARKVRVCKRDDCRQEIDK